MLEALQKLLSGIPSAALRWLFLPSLLGFGFATWQQGTRIAELEKAQIQTSEQRRQEVEAIKDLTAEVRQQREFMAETARKQEQWAMEILRRGR